MKIGVHILVLCNSNFHPIGSYDYTEQQNPSIHDDLNPAPYAPSEDLSSNTEGQGGASRLSIQSRIEVLTQRDEITESVNQPVRTVSKSSIYHTPP